MAIITPSIDQVRQGNMRQRSQKTQITTAQVLALNATPIEVVAAPGAGLINIPTQIHLFLDYNSAAYAGVAGGEDLTLNYTGGAQMIAIEATGFIDASADDHAYGNVAAGVVGESKTPVVNAAMTLGFLVGEVTTGNSPLDVEVFFNTIVSVPVV